MVELYNKGKKIDEIADILERQPGGIKARLIRKGVIDG